MERESKTVDEIIEICAKVADRHIPDDLPALDEWEGAYMDGAQGAAKSIAEEIRALKTKSAVGYK